MCIYHYECDEELDKDDTSVLMNLEEIFHEGSLHMAGPWVLLEVRSWAGLGPGPTRSWWRAGGWWENGDETHPNRLHKPSYSTLKIGYTDNMIYQFIGIGTYFSGNPD